MLYILYVIYIYYIYYILYILYIIYIHYIIYYIYYIILYIYYIKQIYYMYIYIYILYYIIYIIYICILLYTTVYISICFPRNFWKLLLPIGATSLWKSVGGKPVAVFYASQLSNALAKVSETSKSHAKQTSASSWVLLFGTASRNGAPWDILTIAVCWHSWPVFIA